MTPDTLHALSIVAVAALCTILLRAAPFLLFGGARRLPGTVEYLGRMLPPAVIAVLVVYCLRAVDLSSPAAFLPALLSCAAVTALHLWKRSTLLSIGGGTLCYMLLIRLLG